MYSFFSPSARAPAPHRRVRRVVCAGALALACAAPGVAVAARPLPLSTLERLVRGADDGALPALLAAQHSVDAGAYADRILYLKLLVRAYLDRGDEAAAGQVHDRMVRLAREHGDVLNVALGRLGTYDRGLALERTSPLHALNALDVEYANLREPEFMAALQQAYGDAYVLVGQGDFALGHYLKALEIARQHPALLAPTANGVRLAIARVYAYKNAPDKVLATLAQIDAAGGTLAPSAVARRYINEGIAYKLLGDMVRAQAAQRKAFAVAHAHGLVLQEAKAFVNIADIWLTAGDFVEAERAARAALPLADRSGSVGVQWMARENLGLALVGQGDVAAGLKYIDGVLDAERDSSSLPTLRNSLAEKSRALERAGLVREAFQALQEERKVAATIEAGAHEDTLKILQEQFDAQRRAIQIDNLRRENALKDEEIRKRRVWQLFASGGAAVALLLCGFVWLLYRRSVRTSARLSELNGELAYHSTHDTLTGLLNRRSFRETMAARPGDGSCCFVLLDIDHFKSINDRLGHAIGDEVLVEVARRLRVCADGRGRALRWGGEEFLVHVDGGEPAAHAALVRALLDAVAGAPVALADGSSLEVTITAGALSVPAGAQLDWEQALVLADEALYRGKRDGRRCAWFGEWDGRGAVMRTVRIAPAGPPDPARPVRLDEPEHALGEPDPVR